MNQSLSTVSLTHLWIEKATQINKDEQLSLIPDWGVIMQICDLINYSSDSYNEIIRGIQKKLQDNNPDVISLSLTLIEACVKNGSNEFHAQVATPKFMKILLSLAKGSKGDNAKKQALMLIQQWGIGFSSQRNTSDLRLFYDTYKRLQMLGVTFPDDDGAPIFTPSISPHASKHQSKPVNLTSAATSLPIEHELKKLQHDLKVVEEKIRLCREFRGGYDNAVESLADIVDFLTQCRPRMNTLIEAGISGKIDENTLETCLKVNDDLIKVLDEESREGASQTADLIGLCASAYHGSSLLQQIGSIEMNDATFIHQSPPPLISTLIPEPSTASSTNETNLASVDDDFDAFINTRAKMS